MCHLQYSLICARKESRVHYIECPAFKIEFRAFGKCFNLIFQPQFNLRGQAFNPDIDPIVRELGSQFGVFIFFPFFRFDHLTGDIDKQVGYFRTFRQSCVITAIDHGKSFFDIFYIICHLVFCHSGNCRIYRIESRGCPHTADHTCQLGSRVGNHQKLRGISRDLNSPRSR